MSHGRSRLSSIATERRPLAPTRYRLPLHRTMFTRDDIATVVGILESGDIGSDSPYNQRLVEEARRRLGCGFAFPTPSGTHALEMALLALDLRPGDEVLCPSFTFVSIVNAVIVAGGRPVFVDVDPDTLNTDISDVEARVTPRTRAIVVAHYAGIANGLDAFDALARRHGAVVIEDASHALGGRYGGRALGNWGICGAFSFHATKNLTSGEGGLLITSDERLSRRMELIREKGTDRTSFIAGEVDKYTWQTVGSSYLLSEILAGLVVSQWRRIDAILHTRRIRFERYLRALEPLERRGCIRLPRIPAACQPAYHLFYFRLASRALRRPLIERLRNAGIEAASHFVPLHASPYAIAHLGCHPDDHPVSNEAAATLVRLPLYPTLTDDQQGRVIDATLAFFANRRSRGSDVG
jgi:dTDP-4-amino-4,6-dideoxygalactose transaminase